MKNTRLTIRLSDEIADKIEQAANNSSVAKSQIINDILNQFFYKNADKIDKILNQNIKLLDDLNRANSQLFSLLRETKLNRHFNAHFNNATNQDATINAIKNALNVTQDELKTGTISWQ